MAGMLRMRSEIACGARTSSHTVKQDLLGAEAVGQDSQDASVSLDSSRSRLTSVLFFLFFLFNPRCYSRVTDLEFVGFALSHGSWLDKKRSLMTKRTRVSGKTNTSSRTYNPKGVAACLQPELSSWNSSKVSCTLWAWKYVPECMSTYQCYTTRSSSLPGVACVMSSHSAASHFSLL